MAKHDSGQTAKRTDYVGKHRTDTDRTSIKDQASEKSGFSLGSRTDRPHHRDGWTSNR